MSSSIVFSYSNEGFSQGLEWDGAYLYESENKCGINVINQMDLQVLRDSGSARKATVRQYNAPSKGVEDLAWRYCQ
jgi:glutamine cyclotransferase